MTEKLHSYLLKSCQGALKTEKKVHFYWVLDDNTPRYPGEIDHWFTKCSLYIQDHDFAVM